MEQEELSKKSLVEICTEMAKLEQEINLKITMYNRFVKEIIKRYPVQVMRDTFVEKELKDGKDKRKEFRII